ncbi:MAG: insulinase family protein [Rhizobiaceae bacterium]|nr:insulinase family protein [Rhizobiaceae bacterium]MCV0406161.1 insulinase family protein [Rhizobiaceae bacterium]
MKERHAMRPILRPALSQLAVAALALVFLVLPALNARAAVDIQEVRADSGVTAWLVEDYTVPIISIRFAFEGGSAQDPHDRIGLANLMAGLFDEGAADLDSEAFQIRLDDAGAEMSFNAETDAIYGQMRTLVETKDEAFSLLRMAIQRPRFDEGPVDRIRSQIVAGIVARERDPERQADIAWRRAIYGDHPYAERDEGTPESLAAVTRDDLKSFHERMFARSNLKVAVVGAIDPETLKVVLDDLFSALPAEADLREIERADPKLDQEVRVDYPLPQTSIRLAYPGVERSDPEFFAAYMMNQILGGGTFSSRLFEEVREKRGLVYGVSSGLANRKYSTSLVIRTATRSDRAARTLAVIKDEIRRMAEEGPTADELERAKRYVIGAYAINNLDTSTAIARTLVELQIDDLGIDYIDRRAELINGVTLDETKAAAQRLLSVEPAIMLVGPAQEDGG